MDSDMTKTERIQQAILYDWFQNRGMSYTIARAVINHLDLTKPLLAEDLIEYATDYYWYHVERGAEIQLEEMNL